VGVGDAAYMDATVSLILLHDDEKVPGHIEAMIPY